MTTEEKFKKCLAFIRQIEKLDKSAYDTFNLADVTPKRIYCDDCGACMTVNSLLPDGVSENTKYIDYSVIDDLSNKAWHLLADVDGL